MAAAGVLPPGHPQQQPSPHAAAAAYQAGFTSAQHQHHVAAAQMQIQAAQAQAHAQAHQLQQAQMQRAAQMQAMYGNNNSGSNKQHVLPYRPSPSAATAAAAQSRHQQQAAAGAGSVTVSPGTANGKRENSDNNSAAEDIAVSALSMLCGAALGDAAKPAETKTEAATATGTEEKEQGKEEKSDGVPVEGSPSFEETNKTTTTEAAATTTEQQKTDVAVHISPASTVATVGSSGATPHAGTSIKQEDGHAPTGTGTAAASSAPTSTIAAAKPTVPHFPSLLHDILTNSRHAGSVLEWLPHGQGWRVLRWDEMARTVLPEHFPQFCTPGTETATTATTPAAVEKKEIDGAPSKSEQDDSEDNISKAKVTPKADDTEDTTSTSTYADVNAFLAYVRAWGFKEVRDAGPDMGSYRHAVSLLYTFILSDIDTHRIQCYMPS